ncbi:MAG: phosphoribosylamine--glycine ligase [Phycisphaerae bacterium]|nr:phosphoribosylamine--glycine ligase [Phycisphaerae bacterium]
MTTPAPLPSPCNVLLLGTGGREHALAWKLRKSPHLGELWVQDGASAGLASLARICPEPIDVRQIFRLQRWCERENIHFVVIGPEALLEKDFSTLLAAPGRVVFGPTRDGAKLEWDKAYAKQIMRTASIPTAEGRVFDTLDAAARYVIAHSEEPLVVKASGLAAGKGVVVCSNKDEALDAVERIMGDREFGDAGSKVVIEERLSGQEVSVLALVDGRTINVLDPCQDHKQVGEGDTGPNTGGMGAYCPTPLIDNPLMELIQRQILVPVVDALRRDGVVFRGVLYAGLMLTPAGPKVLEFNTRFGDPETQPLMVRLDGDLLALLYGAATGTLDGIDYTFAERAACCVCVCSGGYPGTIVTGKTVQGVDAASQLPDVTVFHAGTARDARGQLVTSGGRVFGVTAVGHDLLDAREKANAAASMIQFEGAFFRRDIGNRVLPRIARTTQSSS